MNVEVDQVLRGMKEKHNPKNLPILENSVDQQLADGSCCLEANLAVLNLYQFNPDSYNIVYVKKILLKALMSLPHPDFSLARCLLTEEQQSHEGIARLTYLSELLETCHFEKFWTEVKRTDIVDTRIAVNFDDAIRSYIEQVLLCSYQNVAKEYAAAALDKNGAQLDQYLATRGWATADGMISLRTDQAQHVMSKSILEKLDFKEICQVCDKAITA